MKKRQMFLLILFLTIGFAGVTTTLYIASKTKIGFNENFYDEIYFSKSVEDNIDTSGESISDSGKKITYKTKELKTIGDKSILEYTILNNSKQYTAHGIVSLVYEESPNIKVTNTLIEFDLEAGNTIDGILTVELVRSIEEDIELPIEVIIDITPKEQDFTNITTTTNETETDTPTITIDTNGGIYEGQEGKIVKSFLSGDIYNVLEPTKEGYEFLGWETNIEGIIVENTITLGKKHLTIKAMWKEIEKDYKVQINDKKYETISKALEEANASDTLTLLKDVTENFTNAKTVTIDLSGFTLKSEIINNGNLILKNGTVENENTVITNNGELTLGVNDGTVDESIKIVSSSTGIKQQGTLNLYDGYIEGILAVEGNVNKVADKYHAYVDHLENNLQKLYLTDTISKAVVKIESNGVTYFNNLQDAINVATKNNNIISAIRSFEASYELVISEESNISFDIASFTVKLGNNLINNGVLTLTNTRDEGSIIPSLTIVNNKDLKLKNITVSSQGITNTLNNKDSLSLENSILAAKSGYALYIEEDNTKLHMDNKSLIMSEESAVYASAKIVFEEIIVKSTNSYAIVNAKADLTINGGNIERKKSGIYNSSNPSTLTINGGNIKGDYAISCYFPWASYSANYLIIINGGIIEGKSYGILNGNIIINGGKISGTYRGISCNRNLEINNGIITGSDAVHGSGSITGGTIIGETSAVRCWGTTTITGGTIIAKNGSSVISSTYELSIGIKDGEVKDEPVIQGSKYGIAGTNIKFYDGIIKGIEGAVDSEYKDIESGRIIQNISEEIDGETYISNKLVQRENFIKVDNIEYNSFESAMQAIEEIGTIELLKTTNYTNIEIPNNKNITIDLKGNNLMLGLSTITNNGTLTITDTSEGEKGTISSINTTLQNNSGKKVIIENVTMLSTNRCINNGGDLTIKNGKITSTNEITINNYQKLVIDDGIIISNSNNAINNSRDITINKGLVIGEKNGIYDTYKFGQITINGGSIEGKEIGIREAKVIINGGQINGFTYGLYKSNVTINNGIITGSDAVHGSGSITGGTIIGETSAVRCWGTTTITGGTIIAKNGSSVISSTYELSIGIKDGEVKDEPVIQGSKYGIAGTNIKFYDGIIKGIEGAVDSEYKDIESGRIIQNISEEIDGETYISNKLVQRENFIKVDNIEYNSFESAMQAIEEIGTIELLKTTNYTNIEIPNNKNITIDLKGNNLMLGLSTITNNGTLTITDTSEGEKGTISSINTTLQNNSGKKVITLEEGKIVSTNGNTILNSGTINIKNGIVEGHISGISSGTFNISGGIVRGNIALNNAKGTISGGTIIGEEVGIKIYGGEVIVTGGTIISTIGNAITFYSDSQYGPLTIGSKDDSIENTPIIQGKLYGILGNSSYQIINYYDGIIKGETGAINREYNDIESNSVVESSTEEIEEEIYITNKLNKVGKFIRVGNLEYDNLQTAIDESQSESILLITDNISIDYEVIIEDGKDITINLNNKYIKTNKSIKNFGDLHLIDDNENALGKIYAVSSNNVLVNNKNLSIDNIEIQNNVSNNNLIMLESNSITSINRLTISRGGAITNKGNLKIENSNLLADRITVLNNYENAMVSILNSTMGNNNYNNYSIYNNRGRINVNNSNIYSLNNYSGFTSIDKSNITNSLNQANGNVEINNSKLGTENENGRFVFGTGLKSLIEKSIIYGNISIGSTLNEATINNNNFIKGYISNSSPNLTLNGNIINGYTNEIIKNEKNGSIIGDNNSIIISKSTSYGIKCGDNSILNLTNSSIISNSSSYGIFSNGNSKVSFNFGTITMSGVSTGYGIYTDGTALINLDETKTSVSGTNAYGIYMKNGTVNVGTADMSENRGTINASVSKTNPLIQAIGTTSGIGIKKEAGYLNFYDGKIVGSHESLAEPASDVEYNYELIRHVDADTGHKYAILEFMG